MACLILAFSREAPNKPNENYGHNIPIYGIIKTTTKNKQKKAKHIAVVLCKNLFVFKSKLFYFHGNSTVDPDEGQVTKDPGLMSASAKSE